MARSTQERVLIGLAIIGLALALYAISLHYSSDAVHLCNIGETFNCDKVNKSPWSVFLGVPVSIWGTFSYLVVFMLAYRRKTIQKALGFTHRDWWGYFLLLATVMLVFQLYLTFTEIFWIRAYCIVCIGSQIVTIGIAAIALQQWRRAR